jgi:hypothetical protein
MAAFHQPAGQLDGMSLVISNCLIIGGCMLQKAGLIPNVAKRLRQRIFVFRHRSHKTSQRIWDA